MLQRKKITDFIIYPKACWWPFQILNIRQLPRAASEKGVMQLIYSRYPEQVFYYFSGCAVNRELASPCVQRSTPTLCWEEENQLMCFLQICAEFSLSPESNFVKLKCLGNVCRRGLHWETFMPESSMQFGRSFGCTVSKCELILFLCFDQTFESIHCNNFYDINLLHNL